MQWLFTIIKRTVQCQRLLFKYYQSLKLFYVSSSETGVESEDTRTKTLNRRLRYCIYCRNSCSVSLHSFIIASASIRILSRLNSVLVDKFKAIEDFIAGASMNRSVDIGADIGVGIGI